MSLAAALVVAALSGFVALSWEILWYRVVSFVTWGLPGAFGLLLSAYLTGLALGSLVAGRLCRANRDGAGAARAVGAFVVVANVVAWLVVPTFARTAHLPFWAALPAVGLAAALLGAVLPLVAHFGIAADARAGERLSFVYLANILGSAAGSLLTGFVLLDHLTTSTTSAVLLAFGVALGAAVLALVAPAAAPRRGLAAGALALAAGLVVVAHPRAYDRVYERLLYKQDFRDDTRFAELRETRSGVIAVTDDGTVYGGGAYDGRFNVSIARDRNGIRRAFAISALHPRPARVLMIGLSSGSWAKVVADLPGVEHLTVVEINGGYVDLVRAHPEVAPLLSDPRVEIVVDDGRRWLVRHPDARFDVVVMNTTWHWRAHITNLLSQEFMALARAHLAPGGLFYFNTTSSPDVQRTAALAFGDALRVYNFMAVADGPLVFDRARWRAVLEGARDGDRPAFDRATPEGREALDELARWPDSLDAPPTDDGLERRASLLARTEGRRVVTDDNMVPEWQVVLRRQDPP